MSVSSIPFSLLGGFRQVELDQVVALDIVSMGETVFATKAVPLDPVSYQLMKLGTIAGMRLSVFALWDRVYCVSGNNSGAVELHLYIYSDAAMTQLIDTYQGVSDNMNSGQFSQEGFNNNTTTNINNVPDTPFLYFKATIKNQQNANIVVEKASMVVLCVIP